MLSGTDPPTRAKNIRRAPVLIIQRITCRLSAELVAIQPAFGDELVGLVVFGWVVVDGPGVVDEDGAFGQEIAFVPVVLD
jgi:hypothetical protein